MAKKRVKISSLNVMFFLENLPRFRPPLYFLHVQLFVGSPVVLHTPTGICYLDARIRPESTAIGLFSRYKPVVL